MRVCGDELCKYFIQFFLKNYTTFATYVAIYWINCAKRPSRLIIKHATSKIVATRKT